MQPVTHEMLAGGVDATSPANCQPMVSVHGLGKTFGRSAILKDIGFDVPPGQFVCILGPSGCGKTTLLRLICGFETPDTGRIELSGEDVTRLPPEMRDFGIVFQSYALFPNLTVKDNVAFGLRAAGWDRPAIRRRVCELLDFAGLQDHAGKYPAQLSGGQQQRVALIRALALSPKLLLLDEPLSALDAKVRHHMRAELKRIQTALNITTIMVTHDQEEALSLADRIVVMNEGRIEQTGTPQEIYDSPNTLFVASFIGRMNQLSIDTAGDDWVETASLRFTLNRPVNKALFWRDIPAHLCIRPESILVGTVAQERGNALYGDVENITFNGTTQLVNLRVSGTRPVSLQAVVHRRPGEKSITLGDRVPFCLPPESLLVLGQGVA